MSQAPNQRKVADGFSTLEGGMDSSRASSLIGAASVHNAINFSFRGGHPHPRPGFEERVVSDGAPDWQTAGRFHGAECWVDPHKHKPSQIVLAVGNKIFSLDPLSGLATELANDWADEETFFCQAESYLIIQNGVNDPYIFDGTTVKKATDYDETYPIPTGTIMAYGQGRLFVLKKDGLSIEAGDLSYGGSEVRRQIISASVDKGFTLITTRGAHQIQLGDTVTLDQLVSSPDINGTYLVDDVPSTTTFKLKVEVTTQGASGFVTKVVAPQESDVLRFSETTFLAEGYAFQLPFFMGRVRGMIFPPLEDTATGQGDLLVSGDYGMASFAVSEPRNTWKTTPFQKVVFREFGATSPRSFVSVNGDFFFRSQAGIRNYRNSRMAFYSHGTQPLSGELKTIFDSEDKRMLDKVSAIEFDNRLLMTALPAVSAPENYTYFRGLVSLDFNAVTVNFGKTTSAYDGLWRGPKILQLLAGDFGNQRRAFAIGWYRSLGGVFHIRLWEITKTRIHDFAVNYNVPAPKKTTYSIQSSLETRAFNFNTPLHLKKLLNARIWFADVLGPTDIQVYFRADQNPTWTLWSSFRMESQACLMPYALFTEPSYLGITPSAVPAPACPPVIRSLTGGYFPGVRLPTPTDACDSSISRPVSIGHEFEVRIDMLGAARIVKLILYALDQVEDVGGDCPGILPLESVVDCRPTLLDYSAT